VPPPHLGAADLGGRGVLHQVVDRDAAVPREPGREVADGDLEVRAQSRLRDRSARDREQILLRDRDVLAQVLELVRAAPEHGVELLARDRDEPRVRDPGSVVARVRLAALVGADLRDPAAFRPGPP
jgi:hypothetical protein